VQLSQLKSVSKNCKTVWEFVLFLLLSFCWYHRRMKKILSVEVHWSFESKPNKTVWNSMVTLVCISCGLLGCGVMEAICSSKMLVTTCSTTLWRLQSPFLLRWEPQISSLMYVYVQKHSISLLAVIAFSYCSTNWNQCTSLEMWCTAQEWLWYNTCKLLTC
jgi:hypothetical protein